MKLISELVNPNKFKLYPLPFHRNKIPFVVDAHLIYKIGEFQFYTYIVKNGELKLSGTYNNIESMELVEDIPDGV